MITIFGTCEIQVMPPQTAAGVLGPGRAINMPLLTELANALHWKRRGSEKNLDPRRSPMPRHPPVSFFLGL